MSHVLRIREIRDALTKAGVPTLDDHGQPIENDGLRVNMLAAERDEARAQAAWAWSELIYRGSGINSVPADLRDEVRAELDRRAASTTNQEL